mmetsp:Transcript_6728/g.12661  ORF Transcript_6728/g.12661 Transcript_6728/m.12661 type:complete len:594 (-) Transcript_6728:146-1927(-)
MKRDGQMICHCMDCMVSFLEAGTILTSLTKDNVVAKVQMLQTSIVDSVKHLQEFVELLKKEKENGDEELRQQLVQDTIFSAFDPYINRPLLGNTPVRQIVFSLPEKAIENLVCIYNELESSICRLLLKGNTLARIRRILSNMSISSSSSLSPYIKLNILCRSLIVINLHFDNRLLGQYDFATAIAEDMYCHAVPKAVFSTAYGKLFLERLCKPYYDVLKLYMMNRNRQRAYMDLVMFREWNDLQDEAATVDVCFQNELGLVGQDSSHNSSCMGDGSNATSTSTTLPMLLYVSNYVLSTKIGLMEHHIGLGIELGIFHGHYHLLTAFWYREFLLSARLGILTAMNESLVARMAMEDQIQLEQLSGGQDNYYNSKGSNNKGKKKGKKNTNKKDAKGSIKNSLSQSLNSTDPWKLIYSEGKYEQDAEYMFVSAKRMLCRGTVRFIVALYQSNVIQKPSYKFTTHELTFRKRFESFSQIRQPPVLSYDDFCQGTHSSTTDMNDIFSLRTLIASSSECFATSKSILEKLKTDFDQINVNHCYFVVAGSREEIMNLIKVCFGNSLFLIKLSKAIENNDASSLKFVVDSKINPQFCTLKL